MSYQIILAKAELFIEDKEDFSQSRDRYFYIYRDYGELRYDYRDEAIVGDGHDIDDIFVISVGGQRYVNLTEPVEVDELVFTRNASEKDKEEIQKWFFVKLTAEGELELVTDLIRLVVEEIETRMEEKKDEQ